MPFFTGIIGILMLWIGVQSIIKKDDSKGPPWLLTIGGFFLVGITVLMFMDNL